MAITRKPLENTYRLPNKNVRLTRDEIKRSLRDPEYMMGNFSQIINKGTQTVPFVWNEFQKEYAKTLMPLIAPETRLNRKHYVVVVKPRQVGATVFTTAFINLLCSYIEGINNLGILHILPVKGTISSLARDKIEPIMTGVHPNLFPSIYKKNANGTLVYEYDNIKGNKRNNIYEIVSSNTKAVRGTTKQLVLMDECSFYNHPEELEAAVLPSIPSYGFALVVYLSTFEDSKNVFFLEKIRTAIKNPEDYAIIFIPWYKVYPEASARKGLNFDEIELTEYDRDVIIPELQKSDLPRERWGDAIDWYHRTRASFANQQIMQKEYPTTLDELLESGKNEPVFDQDDLAWQKKQKMEGHMYRLTEDVSTKKPELVTTDLSPIKAFKSPQLGRQYMLAVDPITAIGDSTDNFAATMMDMATNEQVATIYGRDIPLEDWAQYAVSLCKIYNNAIICPESNVGGEFVAYVKGSGYFRFYYENSHRQADRMPGIRTTVSSKDAMIRKLNTLLHNQRIVVHDPKWIEELEHFELQKKVKADNTVTVKMRAGSGYSDDAVASLWIYAGTLSQSALLGKKGRGFALL